MIEQLAVVVIRFKSLLDCRTTLDAGVNMTVVKFLVQDQKWLIIINQWGYFFCIRPGRSFEMFFCQFGKSDNREISNDAKKVAMLRKVGLRIFIDVLNIESLAGIYNFAKINDKLLNNFGHCVLSILWCIVSTISFIFGI